MNLVNQNNENIYELKIKNMMKGQSKIFVFIGYISQYKEAYESNIYIQDLGALSSMFLKSTSFLFYFKLNLSNFLFVSSSSNN